MNKINIFIKDLLQKPVLLYGFALACKINWGEKLRIIGKWVAANLRKTLNGFFLLK